MTPYEELQAMYLSENGRGMHLLLDIVDFAADGYVHITPQYVLIARHWKDRQCWYIHAAVGRGAMQEFFRLAPFELPNIAFARPFRGRSKVKYYSTAKIKRLICILSKH